MKLLAIAGALLLSLHANAAKFTNPIRQNGPDPFIVWDLETKQYLFLTTPGAKIDLTAAPTIEGLADRANYHRVFEDPSMKAKTTVWAPEIHKLGGKWWIYYSHASRPWVLEGGAKPFDKWHSPVQLHKDYGIDGTILRYKKKVYYVYSCARQVAKSSGSGTETGQALCIADLISPTEFRPRRDSNEPDIQTISKPDQPWEQFSSPGYMPAVMEAPTPLYWNNEIYLVYSASSCSTKEYSLGLLHLTGDDPMKSSSWTKKKDGPVFSYGNGEYGTGHNGIFVSPDGKELWHTYHSTNKSSGGCDRTRRTFVQKIGFDSNGPRFPSPEKPGSVLDGPSGEPDETVKPSSSSSSSSSSSTSSSSTSSSSTTTAANATTTGAAEEATGTTTAADASVPTTTGSTEESSEVTPDTDPISNGAPPVDNKPGNVGNDLPADPGAAPAPSPRPRPVGKGCSRKGPRPA